MRTAALVIVGLLTIGLARAGDTADMTRMPFQIPSEELRVALQAVGEMGGLHVVFLSEDVANRNTSGANGNLTYSEALEQLLRGTDLTYRFLEPRTVMILPASPGQRAPVGHSSTPGPANSTGKGVVTSATSGARMSLVTVTAKNDNVGTSGEPSPQDKESRRAELYPKVSKFLTEATALEPALITSKLDFPTSGALPQWRERICPQLTGLSRQEGLLVLTRVLQIAQAARAPIGDKHCSPNLHIYVTDQPQELFKKVEKYNSFNSFDVFGPRGRAYLLDQFIATPRPVKVWYNISGLRIVRVLVIVDQAQLQGVSRDQLADYIAMVALAEIKPDAHLGNTPTILTLFDGTPQTAPGGLSDWDEAFLKSLYSPQGPWRRGLTRTDRLALSMVSKIVP